jgi:hypothetical protein
VTLPPFKPPTIDELRDWYRRYRTNEDVWRLILEVQHARMTLVEMTALLGKVERAARRADFGRLTSGAAPLHSVSSLAWEEMVRAGLVNSSINPTMADAPTTKGAAGFDFDPDEAEDRRLEELARMIARAHQTR